MQRFVRSPAIGALRQMSTKAAAAVPPAAAEINHMPPKKIPGIHGRYAGALYTAASKVEFPYPSVYAQLFYLIAKHGELISLAV